MAKDKFNILKDVKGLHIRFLPETEQEQNISSREFLKQAEFINIDSLLPKEEEEEGENGSTGNGSTEQGGSTENGGSQNGGGTSGGDNGGGDDSGDDDERPGAGG